MTRKSDYGMKKKTNNYTISVAAGNYDTGIIIDLIKQTIQDFWAKVIGLLKNRPVKFRHVIFGLLPYANEI